jgi:hypothetical protein
MRGTHVTRTLRASAAFPLPAPLVPAKALGPAVITIDGTPWTRLQLGGGLLSGWRGRCPCGALLDTFTAVKPVALRCHRCHVWRRLP